MDPLKILTRKFGAHRGPTAGGWINFCHRPCGDRKFRFGIHPGEQRFRCFNCGSHGDLRDLVPDLPKFRARTRVTLEPAPRKETGLPWRPLTSHSPGRLLEEKVRKYLFMRGIPYMRAALLNVGYGVLPPWRDRAIHPWFDDAGALKGWQGRLLKDPPPGVPKMLTSSLSDLPGRWTPKDGALYLHEFVPHRPDTLVIVEGPYDALSARRVCPVVALLGSEIHPAQVARIRAKEPRDVVLALDRDTYKPRMLETGEKEVAKLPPIARALSVALRPLVVRVVKYRKAFKGDIGGRPDKTPHEEKEIARLFEKAEPWRFGS